MLCGSLIPPRFLIPSRQQPEAQRVELDEAGGIALIAGYKTRYVAAALAVFSIAAALNSQPRGAFLDLSMTDAVISSMGWVVSNYLIGGVEPPALGNENMTSAPSGTFATADNPINIAANRDEQWEALARHLGRDDLLTLPDYASREARKRKRGALRDELEVVLRERNSADWVTELNALGEKGG